MGEIEVKLIKQVKISGSGGVGVCPHFNGKSDRRTKGHTLLYQNLTLIGILRCNTSWFLFHELRGQLLGIVHVKCKESVSQSIIYGNGPYPSF